MLRILAYLSALGVVLLLAGAGAVGYGVWHFSRGLPDHQQLVDYRPGTVTRVHAGDGRLLAEFATEKRVFVPIEAIPALVKGAFLAAEDKNFYEHPGIDVVSILRAAITNLSNLGSNRRPIGASTITQQVAKNFLLTNEVSIERKAKEALLALRIEQALSKDRILELYLNEIYLGQGAYGVAAAALAYFNKSLDELSVAEAAFLAALPKAPNNYNPARNPEAAQGRRDYVVQRMREDGWIDAAAAEAAMALPVTLRRREAEEFTRADFFAEEVRRQLLARYGEKGLYQGGLSVRTTLDPTLQQHADRALRDGLIAYDRRHGWRGPVGRLAPDLLSGTAWMDALRRLPPPPGLGSWRLVVVLEVSAQSATIGFLDGSRGTVPFSEMAWARPWREEQRFGPPPRTPRDVLAPGDVVVVEAVAKDAAGKPLPPGSFALRQIPDVDGALVAMDPHTGRVLAMSGGWSYERSQYNRATQALRQPGSAFKPFVYMAALDNGYTPATQVLDAPFVIDQGPGLPKWKPKNYSGEFYGPSPLRIGIEKSRNLMTVRLAESIGMEKVVDYALRFGIFDRMQPLLSMSLGAGETTLMRMTTAYAMIVNGGRRIQPSLIDRVQDRDGRTIFRHDQRECTGCTALSAAEGPPPVLPDSREQVISPATAYQMTSMLQGVVERGTGTAIRAVGKPLGGKTGTTNEATDLWFVGFSPDLAVGIYIGFDNPKSMGARETGSSVAAPVFKQFMELALADRPATPFRIPPGVKLVRVNAETGEPARPGDRVTILEAFKPGSEPQLDGGAASGFGPPVSAAPAPPAVFSAPLAPPAGTPLPGGLAPGIEAAPVASGSRGLY
ncbi:MAG: penicillin-binding protein 1A [Thalassobaculales bacterium]